MEVLRDIFSNKLLVIPLLACFLAQIIKVSVDTIANQKFSFRYIVSTGGMPSAHSALVGALATGTGQILGWSSPEFAIATIFAVIVMYDAAGVRQAAGKQARILNQIMDEFLRHEDFNEERLKELLGHTPFQVLVGLLLGILSSLFLLPLFSK
ncbi:divergent PAP2 family protein [Cyanobacterium aponinum UTEX 3222]|uniref:Acid phosphatase/vanadium-dependent haloperoxidase related protein n=3 Tax=Cyanobacterium aponinum TaxID=379064 RepID=K9Z2J9_CYAAP|nr:MULTISPECIES: divergent PAP2 family protein [Cyanobacterium]RMD71504.1 MAG: divergent PAP2 family protein [Cyanobacteria bacterium J149]WRL41702.1 divergent PAP2 family protein [Cyanobacterium aponinum UTEX 3222]AFZ53426.1 acid phosphatase/vanadium-dependent haloperoxidase related protein [Cyanobacterium aponinum PCC 10605]MBD2393299.1 divergent PAP2 family protein [Cyanobacterium aponinum FACHB-4101]MTF39178.1 divergent PAP2 family protein [Cyanobacterium aponinum 0216]